MGLLGLIRGPEAHRQYIFVHIIFLDLGTLLFYNKLGPPSEIIDLWYKPESNLF